MLPLFSLAPLLSPLCQPLRLGPMAFLFYVKHHVYQQHNINMRFLLGVHVFTLARSHQDSTSINTVFEMAQLLYTSVLKIASSETWVNQINQRGHVVSPTISTWNV